MRVSEEEVVQIPAARLGAGTLILDGEKCGKEIDEALALPFAPVAPDSDFTGIDRIVRQLSGPWTYHNRDRDVPLLQLPPQEVHLRLLLADATLQSQRSITGLVGLAIGDGAIRPGRALQIELIPAVPEVQVIPAQPHQRLLKEVEDIVGQQQMVVDIQPQVRVPARLGFLLVRDADRT